MTPRRSLLVVTLALAAVVLAACAPTDPKPGSGGRAADFVVDASGDGYTDIQSALDKSTRGDVIRIQPGTYSGDLTIDTGGSAASPLLVAASGEGVVILGSITVDAPYVVLDGLELDGGAGDGVKAASAITVTDDHVTVKDSTIQNFGLWGVNFAIGVDVDVQQAAHGTVTGTRIYNSGGGISLMGESVASENDIERINTHGEFTAPGDAFRVFGSKTRISGNHVHGSKKEEIAPTHGDGVQSWDDVSQKVRDVVIEDNVFTGWFNQGILLENDAHPEQTFIADWTVRNNVFEGFDSWGISAGKENGGVPGMDVENNTFVGNPSGAYFGIVFLGERGSGSVRNNIVSGVTELAYGTKSGAEMDADYTLVFDSPAPKKPAAHDVIDKDPLFADRGTLDFSLKPGSPAIDAGVRSKLDVDVTGERRPMGDAVDLGAYEFGG